MAGYNHPNGGMPNYNNGSLSASNGLPSDYEVALQQQRANGFDNNAGGYDFQADLDMFTNTQFFDFEMAEVPETNSPNNGPTDDGWAMNAGFLGAQPNTHQPQNFNAYNNARQNHPYPIYPTATASTTPSSLASPTTLAESSKTRQHSTLELNSSGLDATMEDASREATEEDKRRRNTAASARFRVKKKQREQALEKTAKDMTDRVTYLEQRVQNLEMENKLLKDLITEKSGIVPHVPEMALEEKLEGSKALKQTPAKRKEVKIETKPVGAS